LAASHSCKNLQPQFKEYQLCPHISIQADLDVPVYMELPVGVNPVDVTDDSQRCYVLKLNKSLYGLKQAGYNWFKKLHESLVVV
jgi:hypothetical protein